MKAEVRSIDEQDLQRVVQLLSKTNQFNLTTRRHTRDDVLELLGRDRSVGVTFRVRDRFGDHGLIGLLIAVPETGDPDTLRIDTWLMSCRVIGRTVEQFSFRTVHDEARRLGYRRIVGEFLPTSKNSLVSGLYESLGFRPMASEAGTAPGPGMRYVFDLDDPACEPPATFVIRERATGGGARMIDLYSVRFWLVVAASVCLLGPLTHPTARKGVLSVINLGFIALFLGVKLTALGVLGGILVTWLWLHAVRPEQNRWRRGLLLALGGLGLLAIFVFYKRPGNWPSGINNRVYPILATIGFSYVALRLVEVARAVADGRHPVPDLSALVNYLLPFHMLAAGPIQAYDEFVAQPAVPRR